MSARSRNPESKSLGIESRSVLASSRLQTGVLPFLTTYFGPRTACAGFDGVIFWLLAQYILEATVRQREHDRQRAIEEGRVFTLEEVKTQMQSWMR
jgi:hypothetical protein